METKEKYLKLAGLLIIGVMIGAIGQKSIDKSAQTLEITENENVLVSQYDSMNETVLEVVVDKKKYAICLKKEDYSSSIDDTGVYGCKILDKTAPSLRGN